MALAQLLLAARARFADLGLTDGDITELTVNKAGRLRVSAKGGLYDPITSGLAAVNDVLVADVTDASVIQVHAKNLTGVASTAGVFVFEASVDSTNGTDGTWFSVQAVRSNANTVETVTPTLAIGAAASLTNSWKIAVNSVAWFRVRCTTAVTTGATYTWTAIRGSFATEPVPASQTHAVTGSGTFTVAGAVTTSGTVTNTPATGTQFSLGSGAASTNATLVKPSTGSLYEVSIFNPTAATIYFKLYNLAVAPTVGTSVPFHTIPVPSGQSVEREFGALGKRFLTGIAYAITGAAGDTDATAVAAGVKLTGTYL